MRYNLEAIRNMAGSLFTMDETFFVNDVYIELDKTTGRKLAKIVKTGVVTNDTQNLLISSISFDKKYLDSFMKGQSNVVNNDDKIMVVSANRIHKRFKGIMETLARGDDGLDYPCKIEIGCIEFDVWNISPMFNENEVVFNNINAILYQFGKYQAVVEY